MDWEDLIAIEPELVDIESVALLAHDHGAWRTMWGKLSAYLRPLIGPQAADIRLRGQDVVQTAHDHLATVWAAGPDRVVRTWT